MTIRAVVADDDGGVLSALVAVLDADDRFTVVAQLDSGTRAVPVVVAQRADVILVDLRMPEGGVDAVRAVHTAAVDVVVIVISARLDEVTIGRLLDAGARGVLLKGRLGTLPDDIARCCSGELVLAV